MDVYDYDIGRVKRCVIHCAAPNGLIYPFCAYNSGPTYREKIERKYSMPHGIVKSVPACQAASLSALSARYPTVVGYLYAAWQAITEAGNHGGP